MEDRDTEPHSINIGGIEYTRASAQPAPGDIQIAVLDRGFVFVGHCAYSEDGQTLHIKRASCIRRWGTTKGLGELVSGPLANTALDKAGDVSAPAKSVIFLMAVEQSPWTRTI